jgi:glycosyltransferase involved in cell wall biosynthesis
MPRIKVPEYIQKHFFQYDTVEDIPETIFEKIRDNFKQKTSLSPMVSVVVIAFNEEKNILKSLSSLSAMETKYPVEVIFVDNNSTDRTGEIIQKCGAKYVFEKKQGVGHARQAGLDASEGQYHLTADADSIYPPDYVDVMMEYLKKEDIVAVFGRVSFLADGKKPRKLLALYEFFKDLALSFRAIKRPELSLGGASFGFVSEHAKTIGWRVDIKRGEDGAMAQALKKYGKIQMVKNEKARIWTSSRTLDADGSFFPMVLKRVFRESRRVREYMNVQKGEYKTKQENIIK